MIKIYFDNALVDSNSYTNLSNEYELFSNDFFLGSTASNYFKFSIDKTKVNANPKKIIIKDDNGNIAVLHPDSIKESKYTFDYECTDVLTLMEKSYDASPLIETSSTGYITLLELVQDICSKYSIELGTTDFIGYDKHISWYDNSRNARTYIGYVAELNGGYATIGTDGKLYFEKQNKTSSLNISINDCDDFTIGEYHKITRVVFDNGIVKYEFGTSDGDTIYLDTENVFITEESDVQNIYNLINNLEFYTFEVGNCPVSVGVRAGDIISFVDGDNIYKTIAGYSLYYYGQWQGNYKLDIETNIKKETQIISLDRKVKNISSRMNYDEAKLETIAELADETSEKMSKIEQTVDGITTTVSTITTEVDNTIKSISKQYKIKDSTDDWSDTYPTRQEGQVILAREKYIHTDNSVTYGTEYEITGDKGDDGIDGTNGKDGTSQYFFVRYSENSTGNPMTTAPTSTTKYMGVANTTSSTAPTSYSDYTWSLIKGNDGKNGTDGTPGAAGADGQTTYLHIKYSQDGKTFAPENEEYAEGETPSAWRGEYVDFTEADSMEFDDYKWYKLTEDIDGRLKDLEDGLGDVENNYKTYTDNEVKKINDKFAGYATTSVVTQIESKVKTALDDSKYAIDVSTEIKENGVTKLKTEKGFTFDDNGLGIDSSDSKTSFNADTDGIEVKNKSDNTSLLFAGYDSTLKRSVVRTDNIEIDNYAVIGDTYRLEVISNDTYGKGLAFFNIGG